MNYETVWTRNTHNFVITLDVAPETDAPEDSFDFEEDIAFAREGGWHWFCARVRVAFHDADNPKNWVIPRNRVLGEDHLAGCSYHNLNDFIHGGYFRDMVANAIAEARGTLERLAALPKRADA